jgi:hypothetical protein
MLYRTHQDRTRILVEQVDESGDVLDFRLSPRTDLAYLKDTGMSEDILRLLVDDGEATDGGLPDHTKVAKEMAGAAVNWTGEHTKTGFVFVEAE